MKTLGVEMADIVDPESQSPLSMIGGRYRLNRLVGKGGMGAVYKAYDEQLKRYVAIKCLLCTTDRVSKESALQEAWTLSSINHPNVMHIFDVVTIEDQIWLVTEWVEGEVLSYYKGALHPLVTAAIMSQVYQGLAASHENGVIHRDIKPANIMVTTRGRVVLLDYGVALAPGISSGETIVGSLRYTDARILEGQKADQYSDLFSASLVTIELLTGRPVLPELAPLPAYRYVQEKLEERLTTITDGLYPPLVELALRYLSPHKLPEPIENAPCEAHYCADVMQDIFVELTEHSPYKVLEKFNQGSLDWDRTLIKVEELTQQNLTNAKTAPRTKARWFAFSESIKNEPDFVEAPEFVTNKAPQPGGETFFLSLDRQKMKRLWLKRTGLALVATLTLILIAGGVYRFGFMSSDDTGAKTFGTDIAEEDLIVGPPDIMNGKREEKALQEQASEEMRRAVKEAVKEAMVEANIKSEQAPRGLEGERNPKLTVKTFELNEPGRLFINGVNQGFIIDRKPISISFGRHEIWIERNGQIVKLPPVNIGADTSAVIRVEQKRAL